MELLIIILFLGPLAVKIVKARTSCAEESVIFAFKNIFYLIALSLAAVLMRSIVGYTASMWAFVAATLFVQYKMLIEAIGNKPEKCKQPPTSPPA